MTREQRQLLQRIENASWLGVKRQHLDEPQQSVLEELIKQELAYDATSMSTIFITKQGKSALKGELA